MDALVIDDSSTTRRIIAGFLGELGFSVLEAPDGRSGLERLMTMAAPRIVVLDWNMPTMDGLAFLRALRANKRYDQLPVVMVTTEVEKGRIREALAQGANEYVMKPFTREVLQEKLALLGVEV